MNRKTEKPLTAYYDRENDMYVCSNGAKQDGYIIRAFLGIDETNYQKKLKKAEKAKRNKVYEWREKVPKAGCYLAYHIENLYWEAIYIDNYVQNITDCFYSHWRYMLPAPKNLCTKIG